MTNRQVAKSRRMMQDALLELLKEKLYSQITITEINLHANLSRRTFYKHFQSKDDLMVSLVDDIFAPIFVEMSHAISTSIYGKEVENAMIMLFRKWEENKEILRMLRKTNCDILLLQWFTDWFHKMYIESVLPQKEIGNEILDRLTSNVIAGAYFRALTCWADSGMIHPPELVAKYLFTVLGISNVDYARSQYIELFRKHPRK